MDIRYDRAGLADLDRLVQFIEVFYDLDGIEVFYDLDGHAFDPAIARRAFTELIEQESYGRVWLIRLAEVAAGYVVVTFGYSLEYHGRDAIVDELYLAPDYRGQGIGTQTLQFVEAECRQLGIHALHLEVMADNAKARRLYQKLGYRSRPSTFLHKWLASAGRLRGAYQRSAISPQ